MKIYGIGISEDQFNQIQVRQSSSNIRINLDINQNYNEGSGGGLGLIVVNSLLNKMNHIYLVHSTAGIGTKFDIRLTEIEKKVVKKDSINYMNEESNADQNTIELLDPFNCISSKYLHKNSIASNHSNYSNHSSNMNYILLVEDNVQILKSTKNVIDAYILENKLYHFETLCCDDGIEMLRFVKEDVSKGNDRIKIIISDKNMEYMSGSIAIQFLKNLEKNNKISYLFTISLTAFTDENTINTIKSRGSELVIEKPMNKEKFRLVMDSYF